MAGSLLACPAVTARQDGGHVKSDPVQIDPCRGRDRSIDRMSAGTSRYSHVIADSRSPAMSRLPASTTSTGPASRSYVSTYALDRARNYSANDSCEPGTQ